MTGELKLGTQVLIPVITSAHIGRRRADAQVKALAVEENDTQAQATNESVITPTVNPSRGTDDAGADIEETAPLPAPRQFVI